MLAMIQFDRPIYDYGICCRNELIQMSHITR